MNVARRRLLAQRIAGAGRASPAAVVCRMGALQAQDERHALWAIGLRAGADRAEVERAVADRQILRTWTMRGTIHVVPAEDAGWMLRLCAARVLARDGRRLAQLGFDERDMARCRELFTASLAGGRVLTRAELMAVLEHAGTPTGNQRGYHALWHAAQSGLICFGPTQGTEQTFVLLDEWVPNPRRLDAEEALAELARRYFVGHGPATARDFAWWAGITLTEARAGLAAAHPHLARAEIDGADCWMDPEVAAAPDEDDGKVHLLPGFDEFVLGYQDRRAVLAPVDAPKIVPGGNGVFKPTVVDGEGVVGTWSAAVKRGAVAVGVTPFGRRDIPEDRVRPTAARHAAYLGLPLASVAVAPAT